MGNMTDCKLITRTQTTDGEREIFVSQVEVKGDAILAGRQFLLSCANSGNIAWAEADVVLNGVKVAGGIVQNKTSVWTDGMSN